MSLQGPTTFVVWLWLERNKNWQTDKLVCENCKCLKGINADDKGHS